MLVVKFSRNLLKRIAMVGQTIIPWADTHLCVIRRMVVFGKRDLVNKHCRCTGSLSRLSSITIPPTITEILVRTRVTGTISDETMTVKKSRWRHVLTVGMDECKKNSIVMHDRVLPWPVKNMLRSASSPVPNIRVKRGRFNHRDKHESRYKE